MKGWICAHSLLGILRHLTQKIVEKRTIKGALSAFRAFHFRGGPYGS